jgi:hypothetical protein
MAYFSQKGPNFVLHLIIDHVKIVKGQPNSEYPYNIFVHILGELKPRKIAYEIT